MVQKGKTEVEELIQCFDELGTPTVAVLRKLAVGHFWHGVVNVAVVARTNGNILCSLRALSLPVDAGKMQSYFGGGLKPGESHLRAAVRELREESRIECGLHQLVKIDEGFAVVSKRFYRTYVLVLPEAPAPFCPTGEIVEFFWLPVQEYLRQTRENVGAWCGRLKEKHLEKIAVVLG